MALHGTVSILSLAIFNLLLGGSCHRAALLASMLFAVHPIHAEAVSRLNFMKWWSSDFTRWKYYRYVQSMNLCCLLFLELLKCLQSAHVYMSTDLTLYVIMLVIYLLVVFMVLSILESRNVLYLWRVLVQLSYYHMLMWSVSLPCVEIYRTKESSRTVYS